MKKFIVVGKSERIVNAVLQGIFCFTDAKCTVIGDHETEKLHWSTLCSGYVRVTFDRTADLPAINAINKMFKDDPEIIVVPADCHGIRLVDRIRDRIHAKIIPTSSLPMLDQMDDKWQFHEFCTKHQLDVPTTFYAGRKVNLHFDDIVSKIGLPFVVKPANESGSFGVMIIRDRQHFLDAIVNADDYQFSNLIVQRYIEGEDIDISMLANNGRVSALAIQQVDGPAVRFVENPALQALGTRLCAANSFHGAMHIDARIEKGTNRVFLIECNPRFWASLTAAAWCGLNFVEESIKGSTGEVRPLRLVAGTAYTRHPVLRPSTWHLLLQSSPRGRLTRIAMLDAYTLGKFMLDLPTACCRRLGRMAEQGLHAVRKA